MDANVSHIRAGCTERLRFANREIRKSCQSGVFRINFYAHCSLQGGSSAIPWHLIPEGSVSYDLTCSMFLASQPARH